MKNILLISIFLIISASATLKSQDTIRGVDVKTIDIIAPATEEIIEEEPVIVTAEKSARFQGGDLNTFREWIQKNLIYPEIALENGIQGKIYVQFHVTSKGNVVEAKILRGVDPSLDNEVLRVVMSSPVWEPAKQGGVPVKQQYVIPVIFDPGKVAKQ